MLGPLTTPAELARAIERLRVADPVAYRRILLVVEEALAVVAMDKPRHSKQI